MKRELKEKELKDSLMELYLKNLSIACQIIDGLIPTIWKFDGKVYNARFDNAIREYLAESYGFCYVIDGMFPLAIASSHFL